jgi:hypothetical protein
MVTLSLVVAGVMLAAGGIIAGIVVALRRPNPDDEPKLILVEHTATAATAPPPIPPVPTTATTLNRAEPATSASIATSAPKPTA